MGQAKMGESKGAAWQLVVASAALRRNARKTASPARADAVKVGQLAWRSFGGGGG
jgi:hypothetical protein